MGLIYRAEDRFTKRMVILKTASAPEPGLTESLIREFRILHDLKHPCIPDVFDISVQPDGTAFYTMEVIEGSSLAERISANIPFSETGFYSVIFQLLLALGHLERKQTVHRDLKPSNIMISDFPGNDLSAPPSVKIIDFGLAVRTNDTANQNDFAEVAGTIQYSAPEAIKKIQCDHRCDLYSLGVILYEWLSGVNPFDAGSVVQVVVNHLEKNPDPPLIRYPFVPEAFIAVVMKCLNKNPDHRYQNTGEIFQDLLQIPGISAHWNEFHKSMGYYLKESYFDIGEIRNTIIGIIRNHRQDQEKFSAWIHIDGKPLSGKSVLMNEIRTEAGISGFAVAELNAQKSSNPFFNLAAFLRSIRFAASAGVNLSDNPGISRDPETPLLDSLSPDEEEMHAILHETADIADSTPVWIWLIDSSHGLSEPERGLFRQMVALIRRRRKCRLILIDASLPGCEPFFGERDFSFAIPEINDSHICRFIGHLLDDVPFDDTLTDFIVRRLNDNFYLIRETVRHCLRMGSLRFSGSRYDFKTPEADTVPDSVQAFLISRLDELSEEDLSALNTMSLFSGEWSLPELTEGARLRPEDIQALVRKGFADEDRKRYRIGNAYLRRHLYESIPQDERIRRHRELADYYQGQASDAYIKPAAEHLWGAGEKDKAKPFLIRMGRQLKVEYRFQGALEAFEKARSVPERPDSESDNIVILEELIDICDRTSDRKKQSEYLREMDTLTADGNRSGDRIRYYVLFCNYLERISSYDEMERTIGHAARFADEHRLNRQMSPLYRLLGKSYYQRARWQDALVSYQRALAELPEDAGASDTTEIMNSIGTVYGTLGKRDLAARAFESVLESAVRAGDEKSQINALLNLGYLAHRMNNDAKALEYYAQAERVVRPLKNPKYEQRLCQYMGISYRMEQQFEKALACFERSEEISRETDDRQTLGNSLSEQSAVYHRTGNLVKARERAGQSFQIADQLNNTKGAAVRRIRQAEILGDMGNTSDATALLHEAKSDIDEHGGEEWRIYSEILNLRQTWGKSLASGDPLPADHYKERCANLISGCEKNGYDSLHIRLLDLLAEIFQNAGQTDDAMHYASEAYKRLEALPRYEFDDIPVQLRYFELLRATGHSRAECAAVLEKSFAQYSRIEKSLNRSELKEYYYSKPSSRALRESYEGFFQEERRFREQSFAVLLDMVQSVNSILEPEVLFEKIMDETLRHSGADRGLILIRDEDNGNFEIRTARHIKPEDMQDITQISLSLVQDVYRSGLPVVTADAQTDERFRERKSVVAYQIRSVMCVPLKIKDRMIGAVYVDKRFDAGYFGPANVQFLESFAHLAAIAIENAKLYRKVRDEKEILQKENIDLRLLAQEKYITHNLAGKSKGMREVFRSIDMAAANQAAVIIEGESGTGKELVARAIHFSSPRKNNPFVAVDCGSLPESLLESELFGYRKGAFTGAIADKKGLFEEADGGTLFMDEITNTTLNFQSKLLRVLQEGEIRRIGDNKNRKLDVRIIAATNKSLLEEVGRSVFREDLYYRLNVLKIRIPPLRERREDIPLLVHYFIRKFSEAYGKKVESISPDLLDVFMKYAWPGNIRELENLVNRLVIFSSDTVLSALDLPSEMKHSAAAERLADNPDDQVAELPFRTLEELENYLNGIEKKFWNQVLRNADGNKSKAADQLGIKRTTLNDRLKKFGLL